MVYSKGILEIILKNHKLYKCIVTLICGFHQLRVKQRVIYKRSNCIGIKEQCLDAGVVAPGSAAQAMEVHHYYRCINLHKECFDAMV